MVNLKYGIKIKDGGSFEDINLDDIQKLVSGSLVGKKYKGTQWFLKETESILLNLGMKSPFDISYGINNYRGSRESVLILSFKKVDIAYIRYNIYENEITSVSVSPASVYNTKIDLGSEVNKNSRTLGELSSRVSPEDQERVERREKRYLEIVDVFKKSGLTYDSFKKLIVDVKNLEPVELKRLKEETKNL